MAKDSRQERRDKMGSWHIQGFPIIVKEMWMGSCKLRGLDWKRRLARLVIADMDKAGH